MRYLLTIFFLVIFNFLYSQKLKEYNPIELRKINTNFSEDFIQRYNSKESLEICNEIWERMNKNKISFDDLPETDKIKLSYCDEFEGNPWTIQFTGCSWYCGGLIKSIHSTSELFTNYIHDGDYGTAWKSNEKIKNNSIEYIFKPESARVTDIIIVNGNVKTAELFQEFSRVKKLMMYVNDKPFAILNLSDINSEQVFAFKPIGHKKNKNYEPVKKTNWKISFKILETYKGKLDTVSLSEIYFGGDGHE